MDRNIAHLDDRLQPLAQQFLAQCHAENIPAFITQTYRSSADQDADYAVGRTPPGPHIVTNAKGGQSPHNCCNDDGTPGARAFDFGIENPDGTCDWNPSHPVWQRAIAIGKALGLVSGSDWHSIKDYPHFELPDWNNS